MPRRDTRLKNFGRELNCFRLRAPDDATMKVKALLPEHAGEFTDQPANIQAAVIYEEPVAGGEGVRILHRVAERLTEGTIVERLWNFEILRGREVREQALEFCAAADIIVVCMYSSGELPAHIVTLTTQAMARHHPAGLALVAVTRPNRYKRSTAFDALRRLCGHNDLFLCSNGVCDGALTPETIHQRAHATSSVLEHILHDPHPVTDTASAR